MIKIKKAIITLGGLGTRFLPAVKAVPKEMLAIIDKPIVQYSAEEVVASGVTEVILVVREGAGATRKHFSQDKKLREQLIKAGKKELAERIWQMTKMAKFRYVTQTAKMPYGNGTPLKIASRYVSDGPFYFLFGDDLTIAHKPVCEQLAEVYQKNPEAGAVVAGQEMPSDVLHRYGVVKLKKGSKNLLEKIVEKPKAGEEPSRLVSFGRFLLTPRILPIINQLKPGKDKELWLTDAITELAKKEKVIIHKIKGKWLTTGDPINYLIATLEFVKERPELKEQMGEYIVEKWK